MIIGFTGHRNKLCSEQSLLRIEERFPGAKWVHGGRCAFVAGWSSLGMTG